MSARRRHQNAPAQPINNASPYSTAKAHIYKPKDQQSIWLEKVGKAVSLTYHDNIKRIYRNIAKKKCPNVSLVSEAVGASLIE